MSKRPGSHFLWPKPNTETSLNPPEEILGILQPFILLPDTEHNYFLNDNKIILIIINNVITLKERGTRFYSNKGYMWKNYFLLKQNSTFKNHATF